MTAALSTERLPGSVPHDPATVPRPEEDTAAATHAQEGEAAAVRKQRLWTSWRQEEERAGWRNWLVGAGTVEEVESSWETVKSGAPAKGLGPACAHRDKIRNEALMNSGLPSTPLVTIQALWGPALPRFFFLHEAWLSEMKFLPSLLSHVFLKLLPCRKVAKII